MVSVEALAVDFGIWVNIDCTMESLCFLDDAIFAGFVLVDLLVLWMRSYNELRQSKRVESDDSTFSPSARENRIEALQNHQRWPRRFILPQLAEIRFYGRVPFHVVLHPQRNRRRLRLG